MYNLFNLGKHKNYCTSFKVFDDGDCHIELVEDVQYEDKKDIYEREKHYIKNNDCVNKSIPNRTRLEYYNDNADKLKQHQKNLYNADKQKKIDQVMMNYRLKNADVLYCDCGGKYRCFTKAIHETSKKHLKYVVVN
jgi:hypothetical protein